MAYLASILRLTPILQMARKKHCSCRLARVIRHPKLEPDCATTERRISVKINCTTFWFVHNSLLQSSFSYYWSYRKSASVEHDQIQWILWLTLLYRDGEDNRKNPRLLPLQCGSSWKAIRGYAYVCTRSRKSRWKYFRRKKTECTFRTRWNFTPSGSCGLYTLCVSWSLSRSSKMPFMIVDTLCSGTGEQNCSHYELPEWDDNLC